MQDGYRDILKMADNFAAFNQRLKYAHYRPTVPVEADPKSWWKYAYKVVTDEMKKARQSILPFTAMLSVYLVFSRIYDMCIVINITEMIWYITI